MFNAMMRAARTRAGRVAVGGATNMAMLAGQSVTWRGVESPAVQYWARNAAGALFGVVIGLVTLGASEAWSQNPGAVGPRATVFSVDPTPSHPRQVHAVTPGAPPAADAPLRIRGRVGDGLYDSLLVTGVPAEDAAEFVKVVARRLNLVRDIGPDDNFDLVLMPTGGGAWSLAYAAVERPGATDLQLMRWRVGGRPDWLDTEPKAAAPGTVRPVPGRVTSAYGLRFHPILHFTRMHKGIDFAARVGTPITATADGTVSRASWAGGYGRQIRIDHGGGMMTSYSHMSGFAVAAGGHVHAGQVIGYVGSSGLSTGPHLHYEVYRNGVPVNPAILRFGRKPPLAGPELARFESMFGQMMTIAIQPPRRG